MKYLNRIIVWYLQYKDREKKAKSLRFMQELPVAVPIPIKEEPALAIIARTSAKSTLTKPGTCNQQHL